jgi:hypothetical protein
VRALRLHGEVAAGEILAEMHMAMHIQPPMVTVKARELQYSALTK